MIKVGTKIISKEEVVCNNLCSQARGLMFRKKKHNLIMTFPKERKVSLHMFFVFYPIDVLLLNENKKIVEIKKSFKPFRQWRSKIKGNYIVELGKEESKGKVKVGDQLEF